MLDFYKFVYTPPTHQSTWSISDVHLISLGAIINPYIDMIAEKVQIPRNMWDEYALCVNFDKESKQLEMALKFLQNAKSLSSLKKLMNSMTSSSGGGDLISKIRVQNFL